MKHQLFYKYNSDFGQIIGKMRVYAGYFDFALKTGNRLTLPLKFDHLRVITNHVAAKKTPGLY